MEGRMGADFVRQPLSVFLLSPARRQSSLEVIFRSFICSMRKRTSGWARAGTLSSRKRGRVTEIVVRCPRLTVSSIREDERAADEEAKASSNGKAEEEGPGFRDLEGKENEEPKASG